MAGPVSATWKKSSFSGRSNCVEVCVSDGDIKVRDSKNRAGPVLAFSPLEWEEFLRAVRDGKFELLRSTN